MRLSPLRILIFVLLLAAGTTDYYFHLLLPRARLRDASNQMSGPYAFGGDFYPVWLTGRALLRHRTNPYTQEMTRRIQTALFGRPMDALRAGDPPVEFRAFSYPLYVDLLAAPVLPLEFDSVRRVMGTLMPFVMAASVILWLGAFGLRASPVNLVSIVIVVLISYPALEGMYALQVAVWVGAALALAAVAMSRGGFALAGAVLALASVKPQMVWLAVLWFGLWAISDWRLRKNLVLSFVVTMGSLFFACQLILPGWWRGWLESLMDYSRYTLPPLAQLVLGRVPGMIFVVAILALAGAVCWRVRREEVSGAAFSLALSLVLAVTVILAPTGGAVYDQVVLLPAVLWLGFRASEMGRASLPVRVLAWLAGLVVCWQWVVASAVALIARLQPGLAGNPGLIVLPNRMAAPLPFVLLALLGWYAGKVLRGKRVSGASRAEPKAEESA